MAWNFDRSLQRIGAHLESMGEITIAKTQAGG